MYICPTEYAFKNVAHLSEMPSGFAEDQFETLFEACEIAQFDKDKRLRYDDDMMSEIDYFSDIDSAHNEGKLEGIERVARSMKENGFSVEDICKVTGLSAEQVAAL